MNSVNPVPSEVKTTEMFGYDVNCRDGEFRQIVDHAASLVRCAVLGETPPNLPSDLADRPCFGLFITLKRSGNLRSSKGIWGEKKNNTLGRALRYAAYSAARDDYRFPSIAREELDRLSIEVALLNNFKEAPGDGTARADAVKIGVHGLLLFNPSAKALLLPQTALEHNWDSLRFLEALSSRAGLSPESWRSEESILMTFETKVLQRNAAEVEWSANDLKAIGQALFQIGSLTMTVKKHQMSVPQIVTASVAGPIGLQTVSKDGTAILTIMENISPLKILEHNLKKHQEIAGQQKTSVVQIRTLTLLAHALPLSTFDKPERWSTLSGCSVLATSQGQQILIGPGGPIQTKVAAALRNIGGDTQAWRAGKVSLTAYSTITLQHERLAAACNRK